jgi:hypothetical protein
MLAYIKGSIAHDLEQKEPISGPNLSMGIANLSDHIRSGITMYL